ncbi:hypothetical protein, partial [Bacillus coahuilensis]|uniref:hypothetical protein n=1 Tax=Bacillus coahuilensis TaxID=408580 RepID=UPI001ED934DD
PLLKAACGWYFLVLERPAQFNLVLFPEMFQFIDCYSINPTRALFLINTQVGFIHILITQNLF